MPQNRPADPAPGPGQQPRVSEDAPGVPRGAPEQPPGGRAGGRIPEGGAAAVRDAVGVPDGASEPSVPATGGASEDAPGTSPDAVGTPDGVRRPDGALVSTPESPPAAVTHALTLLSCLATEPGAGGVLFLDLDPELLPALGAWLAAHCGAGGAVRTLGSWLGEEELWLRLRLGHDGLRLVPGLLVEEPEGPPPVILVPDLAQASPSVVRAAVTLIGADAAHVEMHGHSLRWPPRARWLAAVTRAEAARLSPHLLDRFPLRVEAAHLNDALCRLGTDGYWDLPAERDALVEALPTLPYAAASGSRPALTAEAAERVVALVRPGTGMRRGLALARVARALAVRAAEPRVEERHVTDAAALLGMAVPPPRPDRRHRPPRPSADPSRPPEHPAPPPDPAVPPIPTPVAEPAPTRPLHADTVVPRPPEAALQSPYPEDSPDALPQLGSLRPPGRRRSAARRLHGRPTGTMRARDVHDLALVPSMVQAAASRLIHPDLCDRPLALRAVDLRQYRRRPDPAHALVLVLDHSRRDWNRAPALAPYLRWAYGTNAAVTVVEFGHRTAELDLCAERVRGSSLLHPGVQNTFEREPGTASPLAHALDLGVHELRRFLRRGRSVVDEALLVVATDGRGNVPLDASLRGRLPTGVRREGVDDALRVAATAATLNRLRAVVIAPDLDQYPELPAQLADALGATLVVTPPHRPGALR
jgi:magnesium chelatase subunit D